MENSINTTYNKESCSGDISINNSPICMEFKARKKYENTLISYDFLIKRVVHHWLLIFDPDLMSCIRLYKTILCLIFMANSYGHVGTVNFIYHVFHVLSTYNSSVSDKSKY